MTPSQAVIPELRADLRVDTVSDYQSFMELERAWNRMAEEAGVDHPFLTHEWIRTWWECFGVGKRMHVMVVRDAAAGGEPVAIAPLMVTEGRMYGLRVRWLEFIHNTHSPRCDFIVTRNRAEVYRAIWKELEEQRPLWDVMRLCQLAETSPTLKELPAIAAAGGDRLGLWPSAKSPYLRLAGTWESYFQSLPRKHRSNIRNRFKRLEQVGAIRFEQVTDPDRARDALEEGLRLEAAGWKGKTGTAIQCRPDVHLFYTRFARRAAERGWLRLHFLSVGGKRIAFDYSLCYRNKLFLLKPAYDPEFAAYSPYNLLCDMVLQDAFARGIEAQDFLGIEDEWKLNWTREAVQHHWLYAFPPAFRGRLLHSAKFRVIPMLKQQKFYPLLRDTVLRLKGRGQAA